MEQAQKLYAANILPKNPTKIITSPLIRPQQTAMYAYGHTNGHNDKTFNFDIDHNIIDVDQGIFSGVDKDVGRSL